MLREELGHLSARGHENVRTHWWPRKSTHPSIDLIGPGKPPRLHDGGVPTRQRQLRGTPFVKSASLALAGRTLHCGARPSVETPRFWKSCRMASTTAIAWRTAVADCSGVTGLMSSG
jgi:hypothetical protein